MPNRVCAFLQRCADAALLAPTAPAVSASEASRILDGATRLVTTLEGATPTNVAPTTLAVAERLGAGRTDLGVDFRAQADEVAWSVSPRGHDPEGTSTGLVLYNQLLDLAPLTVGVMVLAPGASYPVHSHPPQELYLILDGSASWRYGGAETYVDLEPGVTLYNHPGDRHGVVAGNDALIAMYVLWEGDPP